MCLVWYQCVSICGDGDGDGNFFVLFVFDWVL